MNNTDLELAMIDTLIEIDGAEPGTRLEPIRRLLRKVGVLSDEPTPRRLVDADIVPAEEEGDIRVGTLPARGESWWEREQKTKGELE